MKYLITGGAGFIGSHLADRLLSRGDEVVLVDDLSTGSVRNVVHLVAAGVPLIEGSILDHPLMSRLMPGIDVVAHLAASVGVELVVREPLKSLLNNIRGTEIVLDAAMQTGAKVLVISTSEIYGKGAEGAVHEDSDRILGSLFKARWAYATSKEVDEILAFEFWRERGLPTVVARLFNCVGPRQTGAFGMVVPRFVRQALAGEALTVFGDGTQSRCFCHVADTVAGLMSLMDSSQAIGDVFNVGAPNEITVLALAELIIEMTGSSSSITFIPYGEAYEPGFEDMDRRLPDVTKIGGLTGWAPTFSLQQILEDVIEYERDPVGFQPRPVPAEARVGRATH